MATVSSLKVSSITLNLDSYSTGIFTPNANLLLVGFAAASGTVTSFALMECTSQPWTTFSFITSARWQAGNYKLFSFVSNGLTTGSPINVRFSGSGDPATGCIINVFGLSSMSFTGATAVVQLARQDNQLVSTRPSPTFASTTLNTNVLIGGVAMNSSPPGMTPTTDWIEGYDTGYSTPTTGLHSQYVNSGVASTAINWGSSSDAANCSIVLELDASGGAPPATQMFMMFPPRIDGIGRGGIFPGNRLEAPIRLWNYKVV